MTFDERQTWLQAVILIVVPGWYFARVLSQAGATPVAEIVYQPLLIWNIGITILATIVATIAATIATHVFVHVGVVVREEITALAAGQASPGGVREARDVDTNYLDRRDERDAGIGRFGDAIAGYVLGFGVLVPLGLAMTGAEPFWIAQALYGALVVATLASSVAKLVAYRRGLWP